MNANADGSNALTAFYAYKNSFDDKTVWVDIPKDLIFYNTMDPYNDDPGTPSVDAQTSSLDQPVYLHAEEDQWMAQDRSHQQSDINAHGLEALSAAALYSPQQASILTRSAPPHTHADTFHSETPKEPEPEPAHLISPSTAAASNDLNYILNPALADSPIDPSLMLSAGQLNTALAQNMDNGPRQELGDGVESEHKVAYLLRHFSDSPRQWTDRFDLDDGDATRSDEVVAATAILSVYEFISATGAAWTRHLE
ncbi:MAG: hypothetical protein Q9217_000087 [Psora testacea]